MNVTDAQARYIRVFAPLLSAGNAVAFGLLLLTSAPPTAVTVFLWAVVIFSAGWALFMIGHDVALSLGLSMPRWLYSSSEWAAYQAWRAQQTSTTP